MKTYNRESVVRRPDNFAAWDADNPRVVSIFLEDVEATFVPHDDIEGFAVAHYMGSPYGLDRSIQVRTPEGLRTARPGQWIVEIGTIRGLKNHIIMDNDVFRKTFSPQEPGADELLQMHDARFDGGTQAITTSGDVERVARAITAAKGVYNIMMENSGHGWRVRVEEFQYPDYQAYQDFEAGTLLAALMDAALVLGVLDDTE